MNMKKLLTILLVLLILAGCASQKPQEDPNKEPEQQEEGEVPTSLLPGASDLKITVPAGAPALAFYNEIPNERFSTATAQAILPDLTGSGESDVIVIDTVNGVKALAKGAKYRLAATITFGNFYLAATGHDEDGHMDPGDYVVVFSQGATPDLVFHYIYGEDYDENLHYVNAVADATPCLVKGVNVYDEEKSGVEEPYVDYVFIAQPALFAAKKQNENISVYADIQKEYKDKSGQDMIQASVFINDRIADADAKQYLLQLQSNIALLLEHPELFAEATEGMSDEEVKDLFGVPNANIAQAVIKQNNVIGLGYKDAYSIKDSIDAFVSIFGVEPTSEDIYLK